MALSIDNRGYERERLVAEGQPGGSMEQGRVTIFWTLQGVRKWVPGDVVVGMRQSNPPGRGGRIRPEDTLRH